MKMFQKVWILSMLGFGLAAQLRNATSGAVLRGSGAKKGMPCQCEANNNNWVAPKRAEHRCVFIDLGAANGNSFQHFLQSGYGPISNCAGGKWEALLVEANPEFTPALQAIATQYQGLVQSFTSTAAYMCEGKTSFSIDPDEAHNHWGSSMKGAVGAQTVTVPTVNVMKLLAENVAPGDWVILKVDIEGAEYDLIPCLSQFAKANLIDVMFLEEHPNHQASSAYTVQEYATAKAYLQNLKISIPAYHSGTL